MSLKAASIIFADSASRFNKDLTDYLQRNIETAIRRGGLSFIFKIARPSDISDLRQKGVKRLPAMLIDNVPYVGVPSIIQEIQKRIRTNKTVALEKTADEEVRDYHTQILGNIVKNAEGKLEVKDRDDDDDTETMSAQLQSKFNKEIQKRGNSIGHGDVQSNQPSRQSTRDNDENNYNARSNARPRANNINVPTNDDPMADAFASLKNISKGASGEDAQDDALMGTLLARMGME
jgi:hypothetical protein